MNILEIINEEISNFDFLNTTKREKEELIVNTLNDVDFQKQFIIDSIQNPSLIKLDLSKARTTGEWKVVGSENLAIEYVTHVTYQYYKDEEIIFMLSFFGRNVSYYDEIKSDYWFNNIDLSNVDVRLYDRFGKSIRFTAYDGASEKIKYLFKRSYLVNLFK